MKNNIENNIITIKENPRYIFHTPEAQKWDFATLRFLRAAINNGSRVDISRVYSDSRYRLKFKRLSLTGAHERGHMEAAHDVATGVSGEVFANGNGITKFRLLARNLRDYVRNLNYVGYAGKLTEEALGEVPHGHGFDMAQNDAFAEHYSKITGLSGSALQNEAARWAQSTVNSRIERIVSAGVEMAEGHLEAA
jgi:hypothetical protein